MQLRIKVKPFLNLEIMSTSKRNQLRTIMQTAWQFVKRNGYTMSEALKYAWRNVKVCAKMRAGIVKFWFEKIDGSLREAWGTLRSDLTPNHSESDGRKKNDTVQVYYDTEKQAWRCFKKANLIKMA